ncbi:uncharacterized protein [Branchiostoma lanceolatum]|uniref:uncharacterized protein n=1 Tax=Branchiostoma lanceolatum TaxID=7740 RepID=UPI0034543BF1
MYQRFGLARTSEFNIFDEERLSVEIKHVSLVKKCADSYQINRATCKTGAGQAMDLIVEPAKDETFLTGQAVISVWRFLGARVREICTLNLTPQSLSPEHHETGEIIRVSAVETTASVIFCKDAKIQFTAPDDRHSRKGVRKYFFFIKEKVGSDWKDLAFFLDLNVAGIRNIAGRNSDDKSR